MKSVLKTSATLSIIMLLSVVAGGLYYIVDSEMMAERWEDKVKSVEYVENINSQILQANLYSSQLMEAVRMLAVENGLLCERDAKMAQVVAAFEEENRALKASLMESVDQMEDQIEEINDLVSDNETLKWKVRTLESALNKVEKSKQSSLDMSDVFEIIDMVTTTSKITTSLLF